MTRNGYYSRMGRAVIDFLKPLLVHYSSDDPSDSDVLKDVEFVCFTDEHTWKFRQESGPLPRPIMNASGSNSDDKIWYYNSNEDMSDLSLPRPEYVYVIDGDQKYFTAEYRDREPSETISKIPFEFISECL